MTALERGGWGFEAPEAGHTDPAALATERDAVTDQLDALGTDRSVLQTHLKIVAELLGDAPRQLLAEEINLDLAPMNIQRDPTNPSARRIVLQELRNALGSRGAMLPISLAPGDLPPREDFLTVAERYLR